LEKRDWCKYPLPGGVSLNEQDQLGRELAAFAAECDFQSGPCDDCAYHYNNGYFEAVDAEVAYGLVRRSKPIRIVEIGTGYSTRVLAAALERNAACDGVEGSLVSIDPSPERLPGAHWNERLQQVPRAVQDVELELFDELASGDILFIDSSHVVATGSDVTREYLQILPRLRRGVLVHIHDIFLPFDYPRDAVLNKLWFWSEQYGLKLQMVGLAKGCDTTVVRAGPAPAFAAFQLGAGRLRAADIIGSPGEFLVARRLVAEAAAVNPAALADPSIPLSHTVL